LVDRPVELEEDSRCILLRFFMDSVINGFPLQKGRKNVVVIVEGIALDLK